MLLVDSSAVLCPYIMELDGFKSNDHQRAHDSLMTFMIVYVPLLEKALFEV